MSAIQAQLRLTKLFDSLDDQTLARVGESTREVTFQEGQLIVREGDPGDALYVILEGDVQIFRDRRADGEIVLARSGAGEYFGEQALLPGRTGLRNASVRAATPVRLCLVDKATFQGCLSADHPLRESLLKVGDRQLRRHLEAESRLLRALPPGDEAAESGDRHVASGEVIFRQGDHADALYLIVEGQVGIYQGEELIASLGRGQCFGELGLVTEAPRSATAVATANCTLAVVPAGRFQTALAGSPELAALFKTLRRVYKLPRRGRVIQSTGTFGGREALTTIYELANGRRFVASCTMGESLYNAEQVFDGAAPPLTTLAFLSEAQQVRRELRLTPERRLAGITAHGEWPALAELHARMLDREPLEASVYAGFEQTGEVLLAQSLAGLGPLCTCVQVEKATIVAAIRGGCADLAGLQEKLGCGTVCGACIPQIKLVLGNEKWTPVRVLAEQQLSGETRRFALQPLGRPVTPSLPGQHIIVSGLIAGNWIRRAYTVSSACDEQRHYEIIVKREARGTFSTWLFDQAGDDAMLRISTPQGKYFFRPEGKPVVAFVAGIGVTPALAIVRSVLSQQWKEACHVDFSVRHERDAFCLDELRRASEVNPSISVRCRSTSAEGRLPQSDVNALHKRFPGAEYFLCGPASYMDSVAVMLGRAGVSPGRVRIEEFTPAAGAPPSGAPAASTSAPAAPPDAPPDPLPEQKSMLRRLAALFARK